MILKAYSKGLYSNWFFYAPDRTLFDCGEGVSLYMRTSIFAIEKIFITHGHMDHIAGLFSLLCLRQSTKGDNLKPLTIYYPEKDASIQILKNSIEQMLGRFIKYPLAWVPVNSGDRIELKKNRFVEAFSAIHSGIQPLGYSIFEPRKKLKEGLLGKGKEILAKLGADEKFTYYNARLFCYSGDSMPLDPATYMEAKLLLHDSTFLDHRDRNAPLHSTAQEAVDIALAARVEKLILCHISPRYQSRRVVEDLIDRLDTHDLDFTWIPQGRVFEL